MRNPIILVLTLTWVGCLHTQEVEKGTRPDEDTVGAKPEEAKQEEAKQEEAKKGEGEKEKLVEKKPAAAAVSPEGKSVPKPTSPTARPPVEEGRPELAVSPSGLMKPEGARLIQQALAKRGYLPASHDTNALDKETSAALRRFQGDQDLARTGAPDRETVRKLGISLDKVFRSAKDNA